MSVFVDFVSNSVIVIKMTKKVCKYALNLANLHWKPGGGERIRTAV